MPSQLAGGLLAGALLLSGLGEALGAGPAGDRQLREVRERIERLQAEVAAAEKSSGEAADQLRESGRAVSEAHRALFELAQRRRALEAELLAISERVGAARSSATRQEALAEELLRLQYRQRAPDRLRLALEGRDAAAIARHMAYYGYIQRARADIIGELRAKARQLATLEDEARARRDELSANEQAQAREAERLERERAARAATANRIAGDIARSRREIGRLKRDEARLAKLVDDLARALAAPPAPKGNRKGTPVDRVADASTAATPFAKLKGRLRWPVRGELASRFGAPRQEAGGAWKGIFIRSPTGETVRAIADGLVVYADWLRGFGNLLILDHGTGYMSLYAHNEGLLRRVGENVRSGDPIAHVGQTGALPESGLYFELRREGKPFDPMSWVAQ
ncbi:MAG TPA: peptidoglycan DD-metalloendopeptidase family protein [Usitatibacter sp.]|nr:peptidoglycan DD-metalloendopeptidase family protein [Usitatibacter sp.]